MYELWSSMDMTNGSAHAHAPSDASCHMRATNGSALRTHNTSSAGSRLWATNGSALRTPLVTTMVEGVKEGSLNNLNKEQVIMNQNTESDNTGSNETMWVNHGGRAKAEQ